MGLNWYPKCTTCRRAGAFLAEKGEGLLSAEEKTRAVPMGTAAMEGGDLL